jgi:hypothetical protein
MDDIDPESSNSDSREEVIPPTVGSPEREPVPTPYGGVLAFAIIAAVVGGVASALAGEAIMRHYQRELLAPLGISPSLEDMSKWKNARLYSAILTYSTMGGFLGLAMGLAGGAVRRLVAASARAAILGLLLGAAAAALLTLFLVANFFKRYDPQSGDLVLPLLTHGAIWSAAGAIGGLALGLGLGGKGRWPATVAGGFVGAATATIVYEIVGAIAFVSDKTDLPVSASVTTRLMAQLLVAISAALGAALAARQSSPREASSSATA